MTMARRPFRAVLDRLLGRKKVASDGQEIKNVVKELLQLLESHDGETYHHSRRVANYAVLMAQRLGIAGDMLCSLYYGASLHDIGKLDVSQEILQNRLTLWQRLRGAEAALTIEQIKTVRRHPVAGYEILIARGIREEVAEIALYHHKNQENGYPGDEVLARLGKENYLSIEAIAELSEDQDYRPPLAEVVSVADTFDAITGPRSYQRQRPKEDALGVLRAGIGTEYDKRCVAALEDVLEKNQDIVETLQLYSLTGFPESFSRS